MAMRKGFFFDTSYLGYLARLKKRWILCFLLVLVGLLFLAKPPRLYNHWRLKRMESTALAYSSKGDYKNTLLVVRRILAVEPENELANQLMAEMEELQGHREALFWRTRLALIAPANMTNRFDLAETALRFKDFDLAAKSLVGVVPAARQNPRFFSAAGSLALATKNYPQAEQWYASLVRVTPTNTGARISLAGLQLASKQPGVAARAREQLEQLRLQPAWKKPALQELFGEALRREDFSQSIPLGRELVNCPGTGLTEQLLLLEVIRVGKNEEFTEQLRLQQAKAIHSTNDTLLLARYLNQHDLARETLLWSQSLPQSLAKDQQVAMVLTDARMLVKDWPGVESTLAQVDWGQQDQLRLAIRSRAHREQNLPKAAEFWQAALASAGQRPEALITLAQLAANWQWEKEALDLWWLATESKGSALQALRTLSEHYTRKLDGPSLYRVNQRLVDQFPSDLNGKNNFAMLSFLFQTNTARAFVLVEDLYKKYPTNPVVASTYAFGLFTKEQHALALEALEKLKIEQLRSPGLALYYGLLLAQEGKLEDARNFLSLVQTNALLPQERDLNTLAWKLVRQPRVVQPLPKLAPLKPLPKAPVKPMEKTPVKPLPKPAVKPTEKNPANPAATPATK